MRYSIHKLKKAGLSGLFCFATLTVALLSGSSIARPLAIEVIIAQASFDQRTGKPIVAFKMSGTSAKAFAEITRKNIGRKLEIRVDGKAVSVPVVREPILGGSVQINGQFTVQQARDIASRLSSGASKVEAEVVD